MSTKDLLAQYNTAAKAADQKTIKTWKSSQAALQAKLDALPKPKRSKAKSNGSVPEGVSVADLARDAGKNPKVVRARLRRVFANGKTKDLPKPIDKSRWLFAEKDRKAIAALVAG